MRTFRLMPLLLVVLFFLRTPAWEQSSTTSPGPKGGVSPVTQPGPPPGFRGWNQVLKDISGKREIIQYQLDTVGPRAPELTNSYQLLLAYIGHLQRDFGGKNPGDFFDLPQSFCARAPLICQCVNGDANACGVLDSKFDPGEYMESCAELWQRYLAAKEREQQALIEKILEARRQGTPVHVADPKNQLSIYDEPESAKLWQLLVERKCVQGP